MLRVSVQVLTPDVLNLAAVVACDITSSCGLSNTTRFDYLDARLQSLVMPSTLLCSTPYLSDEAVP